jgi:cytochrome c-type biogenesis protein
VLLALGAAAALLGSALRNHQVLVEQVGGALLILFGIALTGKVQIPLLSRDYWLAGGTGDARWWRSVVVGVGFALSWSACTGPFLASAVALTIVQSRHVTDGVLLMLAFAVGQAIPFLLVAMTADRTRSLLRRFGRMTAILSQFGAFLLILLGVVLLSGQFSEFE